MEPLDPAAAAAAPVAAEIPSPPAAAAAAAAAPPEVVTAVVAPSPTAVPVQAIVLLDSQNFSQKDWFKHRNDTNIQVTLKEDWSEEILKATGESFKVSTIDNVFGMWKKDLPLAKKIIRYAFSNWGKDREQYVVPYIYPTIDFKTMQTSPKLLWAIKELTEKDFDSVISNVKNGETYSGIQLDAIAELAMIVGLYGLLHELSKLFKENPDLHIEKRTEVFGFRDDQMMLSHPFLNALGDHKEFDILAPGSLDALRERARTSMFPGELFVKTASTFELTTKIGATKITPEKSFVTNDKSIVTTVIASQIFNPETTLTAADDPTWNTPLLNCCATLLYYERDAFNTFFNILNGLVSKKTKKILKGVKKPKHGTLSLSDHPNDQLLKVIDNIARRAFGFILSRLSQTLKNGLEGLALVYTLAHTNAPQALWRTHSRRRKEKEEVRLKEGFNLWTKHIAKFIFQPINRVIVHNISIQRIENLSNPMKDALSTLIRDALPLTSQMERKGFTSTVIPYIPYSHMYRKSDVATDILSFFKKSPPRPLDIEDESLSKPVSESYIVPQFRYLSHLKTFTRPYKIIEEEEPPERGTSRVEQPTDEEAAEALTLLREQPFPHGDAPEEVVESLGPDPEHVPDELVRNLPIDTNVEEEVDWSFVDDLLNEEFLFPFEQHEPVSPLSPP